MTLDELLNALRNSTPLDFNETIATIERYYAFTPCGFRNGALSNAPGQNSGSCKVFAFARAQQLNEQQTLHCFGQYYRDVLQNPQGNDHQNIRNFIQFGWSGIKFDQEPLSLLTP